MRCAISKNGVKYKSVMKKLVLGIVAHVDAGKTTLSEALLYTCGAIRNLGRVDSKNCFLDTNSIERERGITIFSKQARLNDSLILIDTPGHVDFSAEMERTLSVLDAAILCINASDGIQSHTKTLWSLLKKRKIPVIIFVNKMDMPAVNKNVLLSELKHGLSDGITDFAEFSSSSTSETFCEQVASCDETLIQAFLDSGTLNSEQILSAVSKRCVFPCFFGSALKVSGVEELISFLNVYAASDGRNTSCANTSANKGPVAEQNVSSANSGENLSAIVYKISFDKQNNRLSHIKVVSGTLKTKEMLGDEKINEVRQYSGDKYETVSEVHEGDICAVTGLKNSRAGTVYGSCNIETTPVMEPALIYSVLPPPETDTPRMLKILRDLEEELPEIKVTFVEATGEINIMLMGEVQTEVITQLLKDRHNINISFGEGKIAYKETITEEVTGVGHYEPLKHYAETHIKMIPLKRGEGLKYSCNLSTDVLAKNWQRLILTHLKEKSHAGILTGSPVTDIEFCVVAGKDHLKHTEGGDFRQATYRAIRQGLMKSKSILLEPFYLYEITVPDNCTGRVMNDMSKMCGTCNLDESSGGFSTLSGRVPVSTMKNYINEVRAYTKGQGTLSLVLDGYDVCHNEQEVIDSIKYNPDADAENPSFSVFCSHGAGFAVPWNEVEKYKHL